VQFRQHVHTASGFDGQLKRRARPSADSHRRMNRRPVIVRLSNWIGDVVLTVPALKLLQAHGHELQLVGKGWAAGLLQGEAWRVEKYPSRFAERVGLLKQMATTARSAQGDGAGPPRALCFPNSLSSALELRLADFRSVGYRKEGRRLLLADSLPLPLAQQHELERHWRLACRFLGVEEAPPASIGLQVSAAHQQAADEVLRRHRVRDGYVVIAPFAASHFDKRDKKWPHFPAFVRALLRFGRDIVVCPGPGEEPLVQSRYGGTVMLPNIDLGAYLGVLRRASLVVANDTGPGHMAAAVGAPLISVLGPSNAAVFGPWGPTVTILQDPTWVVPELVLQQAAKQMRQA